MEKISAGVIGATGMVSQNTFDIEDKYMAPFFEKQRISIDRGEGVYVWDEDGNKYLDFTSGWGVTCIGHANPVITKALLEQGKKIIQNPDSSLTYSPARAKLLSLMRDVLPKNLTHIFFSNSGAEANDAAIKLARKVTGRPDVIFLADMEGHGVAAALYTMHLGLLLEKHYLLLENPARFAATINKELVSVFGDITTFAAAICGVIDARGATLRFAGAGGPPPLIMNTNGDPKKFKSSGITLGVMEDIPEAAAYHEQTVPLAPGDAILIFSDGAFEIHNARDELLGLDGFINILTDLNYPRKPLKMTALELALLKFSNDIRLQDDITIIEASYLG